MSRNPEREAVEPEEAPPVPRTAPDEPPAAGKSAEAILASIFAPVAEASPLEQLEQTIRHPKKLIYVAMSNRNFYWRMHVSKLVLDEGYVPSIPSCSSTTTCSTPCPSSWCARRSTTCSPAATRSGCSAP